MAPAKILLLQALFFYVLLLMLPSHCKVNPTSTTPAISQAGSTARSITAGLHHHSMQCTKTLPGVCMLDETNCSSRVYADLGDICAGSGDIYKKSGTGTPDSCQRQGVKSLTPRKTIQKVLSPYAISIGMFSILVIICFRRGWCPVNQNNKVTQDEIDLQAEPIFAVRERLQLFSFVELETAAKRLGSGAFGKVFRACLPDNLLVVVKRRDTPLGSDSEGMFRTEVETLLNVRHDNVVDLIGCCTEDNKRLLVFELMSRKDLYGHVHPRTKQPGSLIFYSWKLRVKVLLDAAKGIEYLHRYAEPRIIHRDIKSKSILINEYWVAKIADFGTAVIGPEQGSDCVEIEMPIGTPGYVYVDSECTGNCHLCNSME